MAFGPRRATIVKLCPLLMSTLSAFPVWAAVPNTVGWHALSGTNVDSVCQWPSGGNSGGSGCAAITGAWNGALFDTSRNRLVLFGNGGHSDYFGNEIISLSLGASSAVTDAQTLSRTRDSSANPQSYGSGCQLADGSPRSFHTYTNVVYLPDHDRYLSLGGARAPDGFMQNCVFYWNPAANTYTFLANSPIDRNGGFWGSGATWDAERKLVWAADQGQLFSFNPTGNTWNTPTQTAHTGTANQGDMGGVVDPVRNRYYLIGDGAVWYWNVTNASNVGAKVVASTTGCGTALTGAPGSAYDPVQDRIVIWNGGSTVTLLNPTTHQCTTATPTGSGPAAVSTGTYGRFQYSGKDNLFVTCQATNQNCYALRLTLQNADSDWLRRAHAPGVTNYQSFDNVADLTNGQHYFVGSAGVAGRAIDTSIKTSGIGSFSMTVPAGNATDTPSGEWRECLVAGCDVNNGGAGFGENSTLYYSYRMRITPSQFTNLRDYWRAGTQRTGWKHANLHNLPQGSCGPLEFTGTIDTSWNAGTQIWYTRCSAPGLTTGANAVFDTSGPFFQQGNNTASTTTSGFWCDWNVRANGTGNGSGCFNWQWQNEWLTFKVRLQIGTHGQPNSKVDIWIAREGGTQWLPIINVASFPFDANPQANQRMFNLISFTNYMTGNNQPAPVSATMWFDEFIASTQDIDLPGQVAPPAPPDKLAPQAPKNLSVQ